MWYKISQEMNKIEDWQLPRNEWFKNKIKDRVPLPVDYGHAYYPTTYIRFGDLPSNENGYMNSTNHSINELEKGVSVYPAWFDDSTGLYVLASGGDQYLGTQDSMDNRNAFEVSGEEIGDSGADGEPLLNPATLKVIKPVGLDQIVTEQDPYLTKSGQELSEDQVPNWNQSPDRIDINRNSHRDLIWQAIQDKKAVPEHAINPYSTEFLYPPYSEQYKTNDKFKIE